MIKLLFGQQLVLSVTQQNVELFTLQNFWFESLQLFFENNKVRFSWITIDSRLLNIHHLSNI